MSSTGAVLAGGPVSKSCSLGLLGQSAGWSPRLLDRRMDCQKGLAGSPPLALRTSGGGIWAPWWRRRSRRATTGRSSPSSSTRRPRGVGGTSGSMVVPSALLVLSSGLRAAMGGCTSGALGAPPARSPGGGPARSRRGMGGGAGTTSSELMSRSWFDGQPSLWPRLQGCTDGRAQAVPRGDSVVGTPPTSPSMTPASPGPGDPTPFSSEIAGP